MSDNVSKDTVSKTASVESGSMVITAVSVMEIVLISVAIYFLSSLSSNADADLTQALLPTSFTLAAIIMAHTFIWYLYSTYKPLNMGLYYTLSTSFSILISLVALSIAIVHKS